MRAAKLALSAGVAAAAALLAALWWERDDGGERAAHLDAVAATVAAIQLPRAADGASAAMIAPQIPPRPQPTGARATETELQAQVARASHERIGGVFVEHLVARGLARSDAERVVRRFFDASAGCLFDALRGEAAAQSVAYDPVLDAIEAELYDSDGPLLPAVIDMRAVVTRVAPCSFTAAQQAGLGPAVLEEAARAALRRAP